MVTRDLLYRYLIFINHGILYLILTFIIYHNNFRWVNNCNSLININNNNNVPFNNNLVFLLDNYHHHNFVCNKFLKIMLVQFHIKFNNKIFVKIHNNPCLLNNNTINIHINNNHPRHILFNNNNKCISNI